MGSRRRRTCIGVIVLSSAGVTRTQALQHAARLLSRQGKEQRRSAHWRSRTAYRIYPLRAEAEGDVGENAEREPYGFHGFPVEGLVAFQGVQGAYSEQAVYQHFGPSVKTLPCKSFEDVFAAVDDGLAAFAMLPMENSQAGSINKSYDLLMEYDLRVHGETSLRVSHSLLALPNDDGSPPTVTRVKSHPQALAQCEKYLTAQGYAIEAGSDTAGSAREISEERLRGIGAICSKLAAKQYGLQILATGIEDNKFNFTRFFVLGKGANTLPIKNPKTSITFAVTDKPGSLVAALQEFGRRQVNIIKLESRPRRRSISPGFNYIFYLDFQGHHQDPDCAAALMGLLESCAFVKLLGTYDAGPTPKALYAAEAALSLPALDPALLQI